MKIHIFGASGSGVTTLGQNLSKKLQLPYFDSDFYFWEDSDPPFTVKREPEIRNKKMLSNLDEQESWIMGGSIISWGAPLFLPFDLVVFLWIPPEIRMERLRKREFERYGEVIYNEPSRNKQYMDFLNWAAGYDLNGPSGRTLAVHERWLATLQMPVLQLRGDLTIAQRLSLVREKLKAISSPIPHQSNTK